MRHFAPLAFAALLGACASLPTATDPIAGDLAAIEGATPDLVAAAQADHLYRSQQDQLRTIAEAEARVDLARARLDYATVRNRGAEDGDVREFLQARQALRDARNVYGPTDTGRAEFRYWRWGYDRHDRRHVIGSWTGDPVGTFGLRGSDVAIAGGGRKLSGLPGSG